jgi:peptidoglycan/LPS O-acetylase OafA/YrhL
LPATPAAARNHGIDLLRGLAILLVVLHHTGLRIPLARTALAEVLPVRLLKALIYNGYEAVFVFFVISGFLIALHAMERWGDLGRIDLRAFYARRAARILPCLALLVAVLAACHALGVPDYVIARPSQSLPRAVLAAFGLHLNWYEGRTGYLPGGWDVLWSLSIEEAFYLGFPLLCLLLRRGSWLAPPLALLALSLPFTHAALAGNEIWQEKAYLPGMAAIAAGVLAAMAVRRCVPAVRAANALCLLGLSGLATVLLVEGWLWPLLRDGTLLLLVAAVALLLAGLHGRAAAGRDRLPRGLGWLAAGGRLSYEIYLSHMFVVFAVVGLYRLAGADLCWGFLWYLPAVAGAWWLGAQVGRRISAPCERWLRARLSGPVAAAAGAMA